MSEIKEPVLRWEDSGGAIVVAANDYDALFTELEQAEQIFSRAARELLLAEARLANLQKALDAAMQYVTPKDREWIESLTAGKQEQ